MSETTTTTEVHRFTREQLEAAARALATLDIVGNLVAGKVSDEPKFFWHPLNGSLEVRTEVTGVWRHRDGQSKRDDQKHGRRKTAA